MTKSQNESSMTSDKTVKLTVKEFIAVCLFLLSLGITIGGYIKVAGEVEVISTKIETVSNDITDIKVQNAKLETLIKGKE